MTEIEKNLDKLADRINAEHRACEEAAILHAELVAVVPAFDTDDRIAAIPDGTTIENLVEAWKTLDALEGVARQRV